MRDIHKAAYGMYFGKRNLYLGCGMDRTESSKRQEWVNLDYFPAVNPDVYHDINKVPLPFNDGEFNCIFSCHTMEHIRRENFVHVVADLHRILAPKGWLIAITPHGASDVAWGLPQHHMLFNDLTWGGMDRRIYEAKGTYGHMDTEGLPFKNWNIARLRFIPWSKFEQDPDLEFKSKHMTNIIMEIHAVMQREED